jgi:predicted nucleic-acid-binding protein
MRAVDTNVLVRLFIRDNETQVAAAEEFIEGGAWISHLVLAETLWVLVTAYRRDPSEIISNVEMLLEHSRFTFQDPDVLEAALAILEIARKAGHMPLGTFDRNLAKVHGAQRL